MLTVENKTQKVVLEIANRLKNFDEIASIAKRKENRYPHNDTFPWEESSLAHGYPGLICLFSELDHFFPGEGWEYVCHETISRLMEHIQAVGVPNYSLISGLTGTCFSIFLASKNKTRYRNLLSKLHVILTEGIQKHFLDRVKEEPKWIYNAQFYDVIVGISGIISYLLLFKEEENIHKITEELLRHLVTLTKPVQVEGTTQPGWYVAPESIIGEEARELYPNGCFDLGLAHGIPGCLAALAKARINGILVEGDLEAITTITTWLKGQRLDLGDGQYNWLGRLAFNPNNKNSSLHFRDGWCYGAPGVIAPLYLAAQATGDQSLYEFAIESTRSLCSRSIESHYLSCPTFCHGYAGLLTFCHQIDLNTNSALCTETQERIHQIILEKYNSEHPFGFKSHFHQEDKSPLLADNPGLLDGTVGVLLSLLFCSAKEKRDWVQIFSLN